MAKKHIFFFLLFHFTLCLFAREVEIFVKDADIDHPLEGALIKLENAANLPILEYFCDHEGKAVIQIEKDRRTLIQVSYPGYETQRIVIPLQAEILNIELNLAGVMQGAELIIEASRANETGSQTGRSIAVTEREIAQTAEIGIIEDVMSTIKLLPGVSYTGLFDAQPSIRGGHPGDMSASFDGFYINNPYHWGGGFSIFDPKMAQSAKLSHGVFSVRYGHTISGLLEITGRKPSATDTLFEISANTSAFNFNYSLPLAGKGGILFMGRFTYYDPVIALAKEMSAVFPALGAVNYIKRAPFIYSGALNGNYRFTDKLEFSWAGFFGADGVKVNFINASPPSSILQSSSSLNFKYDNFQGFLTSSLLWNPKNDMLVKISFGAGFENALIDGIIRNRIYYKEYSDSFEHSYLLGILGINPNGYSYDNVSLIDQSDFLFNTQARIDIDWQISDNAIIAAGLQEMFNWNFSDGIQKDNHERWFSNLDEKDKDTIKDLFRKNNFGILPPQDFFDTLLVEVPVDFSPDAQNKLFSSSGYILAENKFLNGRINTEAGFRIDHFFLLGKDFSASSNPVFNPRINIDFNILKDVNSLLSLDLSAGTGLFSSMNSAAFIAEQRFNITRIKPNRSWTSVLGIRMEFPESLSLNIEGYYKKVFDRMYVNIQTTIDGVEVFPSFNGIGQIWGIDVMLHKVQSRYWDGWLSYSYNRSQYKDPNGSTGGMGISGGVYGNNWYYPLFHRFHTINLVFNFRPAETMNLYIRFSAASGEQIPKRIYDTPQSYPVLVYDEDEIKFIEKFRMPSYLDGKHRSTPSISMDIKYSILGKNKNGRSRYEIYFAVENVLSLIYMTQGNQSYNQYTGQMDTGSSSASYGIPIPIPSFGVKISY